MKLLHWKMVRKPCIGVFCFSVTSFLIGELARSDIFFGLGVLGIAAILLCLAILFLKQLHEKHDLLITFPVDILLGWLLMTVFYGSMDRLYRAELYFILACIYCVSALGVTLYVLTRGKNEKVTFAFFYAFSLPVVIIFALLMPLFFGSWL